MKFSLAQFDIINDTSFIKFFFNNMFIPFLFLIIDIIESIAYILILSCKQWLSNKVVNFKNIVSYLLLNILQLLGYVDVIVVNFKYNKKKQ